ncbi:MAG: queuosine precursor transporter [Candidatus Nanohaloarchaea archaeon]
MPKLTDESRNDITHIGLISLFITALITSQMISSKILAFSFLGFTISMPGGTLAYAGTFFATDCISEMYGKKYAQKVVNIGFFMNFVMLILVWATIFSPAAQSSIDLGKFADILSSGTNIVIASLLAYIISQNWDVIVFHRLRELTSEKYLWLRNIGSTAASQMIDTVIFTVVAFTVVPSILSTGILVSSDALLGIIIGQYIAKLIIALLDTPLVYIAARFDQKHQ